MIFCEFCNKSELENRLVHKTKSFFLVVDKHPVIKEHYLIISREHITSLSLLEKKKKKELESLISRITDFGKSNNKGFCILFERGHLLPNKTKNPSIDHAHAHLFFLEKDPTSLITEMKRETYPSLFSSNQEINNSYCSFWNFTTRKFFIGNSKKFQSQFIRKFISEFCSLSINWNWRVNNKNVFDYENVSLKKIKF